MNDLPKAIWHGSITVLDVEIRLAVLDDGRRVIEAESVGRLLDRMSQMPPVTQADIDAVMRMQAWSKGGGMA